MRKSSIYKMIICYSLVIVLFLVGTFLGNRVVSVISEKQPIARKNPIVLDAGHGGEDGGATSCTGKLESSFNLEITLRLNDLLHLLGKDTVLIRSNDSSVYTKGDTIAQKKASDLKERVRIANSTDGAMLVSIHQNYFPEEKYNGAQVFYSPNESSRKLAEAIQGNFVATINPGSNRKAKKGEGIYLLEHIQCTGVLVECGFISNPTEEKRLASAEYQKMLSSVIALTIISFSLAA